MSKTGGTGGGNVVEVDPLNSILAKIRREGDNPGLPLPPGWNPEYQLRPYQRVGVSHLAARKRLILGDVTGSGKTPTELYAWALVRGERLSRGLVPRLWVVTTKSAAPQWEGEINKFLPGVRVYRMRSGQSPEKRLGVVAEWLADDSGAVLITSWTQLSRDWWEMKAKFPPDGWLSACQVTFDEAHKAKTPKSQVGKAARDVCQWADRVHGLTATLVKNHGVDAFETMKMIAPEILDRREFEDRFCIKKRLYIKRKGWFANEPLYEIVGYRDLDQFRDEIAPYYLGRSDDELEGQRPDVTVVTRRVELSPSQRRVYREAEAGLLLDPDTESVGAPAMVHAQQAANNPEIWYDQETGLTHKTKDNAKLDLLKELLEEELEGEPLLLYSPLETTVSVYAEALKHLKPARITGKEDEGKRAESMKAFNEGRTNLLFLTDAGGESLNLQRAKHVVFLSLPMSPSQYIQVIGRARRFGSSHSTVMVWNLLAQDTVDEMIFSMLNEKFDVVEKITRGRGGLSFGGEVLPRDVARLLRQRRLRSFRQESPGEDQGSFF